MKKSILLFAATAFLCLFIYAADVVTKDVTRLPQTAQTFLKKYFPASKVVTIKIDDDRTYDVKLVGNTEIDFDRNGNWTEVDCNTKAVPSALVPVAIQNYVKSNYSGKSIVKIDRDRNGYDVKLKGGPSLEFNSKGKFIKVDR